MSSDKTVSPGQIELLKREAQQLKQTSGETHANILRKIARREGFKNWEELMKASAKFVPPPMKDLPMEMQGDKRYMVDEGFGIIR